MPARTPSSTRRTRHQTGRRRATAPSLRAFLEQPARPTGTLTYHELQGFLFAVLSAPELIRPSEWLPLIFNEQEAGYSTLEEANTILGQIMRLYNDINAAILEERVALPGDCRLRPHGLDNLEDSAALARWSRGFLLGHEWLEELWDVELPSDLDEELGAVLMTLSFFSSRSQAEAFHQETAAKTGSLEAFAESILRLVPDALAEYAHFGRSVLVGVGETTAPAPKRVSKTGRNNPARVAAGRSSRSAAARPVTESRESHLEGSEGSSRVSDMHGRTPVGVDPSNSLND